jgi:hypothetical protein
MPQPAARCGHQTLRVIAHDNQLRFSCDLTVPPLHLILCCVPLCCVCAAGVGGLLDIVFEESLEGFVACIVFGWVVLGLIRVLKLPVVEGAGL